jgi:hypothetical protein
LTRTGRSRITATKKIANQKCGDLNARKTTPYDGKEPVLAINPRGRAKLTVLGKVEIEFFVTTLIFPLLLIIIWVYLHRKQQLELHKIW